jgi:hypothetical protein
MRSAYSSRDSLGDIVNALDLYRKEIRVPGTMAKIVDFDYENNHYRFVIEFREKKFLDFVFPMHASFSALITAVKEHLQVA